MANLIEDIIDGVKSHLATNLSTVSADEIAVAYRDDRIADDGQVEISKVTLQVIDFPPDPEAQYSGKFHDVEKNMVDNTATLTWLPLPFRLHFQVDTYTRLSADDWQMQLDMKALLASGTPFTTPEVREYSPRMEMCDDQDDLLDGDHHKVYRFSIPVWLADPHEAEEAYLVLTTIFDINNGQLIIAE